MKQDRRLRAGHARLALRLAAGAVLVASGALGGCAARTAPPPERPRIRVAFVGQDIWFIAPDRRWRLEGVTKREVVWSPDGRRLAYVRPAGGSSPRWRVFVRDDMGEPVNEFRVYADGQPVGLEFRNDTRIAYVQRTADGAHVLVEHDTRSGEIVAVKRGKDFVWSPDHRRLAYVKAAGLSDGVHVEDALVYPRGPTRVRVLSRPAWSPDGRSIAFLVTELRTPRPGRGRKRRGKSRPGPHLSGGGRRTQLVVVLEPDNESGDLIWDIPPRSDPNEPLRVFWAGHSRVVVGPEQLKPRFTASWHRQR